MFPLWLERLCNAVLPVLVFTLLLLFAWIAVKRKRLDLFRVLFAVTIAAVLCAIIYRGAVDGVRENLPEIGRPLPVPSEDEPQPVEVLNAATY